MKGDFTEVFGKAFLTAFTEPTIRAAFEKTGIYPFNPEVITAKQLKPSEPTSTIGSLLIPMPSPVRAIMAVFNHCDVTAFDSSPDTHLHAPMSSITNPSTPTPVSRIVDHAIDPTLFMPTKHMCIMTSTLASRWKPRWQCDKLSLVPRNRIHDISASWLILPLQYSSSLQKL